MGLGCLFSALLRYDIYARVCMLLGFSSFVQALAFYANGHIVVELRGFYVAHATAFVLEVLHVLLLRFDIIQGRVKPLALHLLC